jgi:aryl-alcohol dehydrogenase-like predicted oxidoreductase
VRLALGTAQFGQKYGVANLNPSFRIDIPAILKLCRHQGIHTIDTAQAYGDCETLLGQQEISDFDVITKISIPSNFKNLDHSIYDLVKTSKENLRQNQLHGVLVHNPNIFMGIHGLECFKKLEDLKNNGVVDLIGVSVYTPEETEFYLKNYQFDVYQIPLSVFDTRFYQNDLIKRIKNSGSQIYARSIFLQGLLINEAFKRPAYFDQWGDFFKKYYEIVVESGLTPIQFCLATVLSDKDINKVVVGVDSLLQLQEIVESYSEEFLCPIEKIGEPDLGLIDPRLWR